VNWELTKQHQKLKALAKKAGDAGLDDFELLAHWAKYLCVLVAGFLENSLAEVYSEFVTDSSSPAVARFATTMLGNIQNPKAQRFLEITGAFDDAWRVELERFLAANGRKEALDSVMANRHQIAHGENSGITLVRVNQYLEKCVEVIDFLESQCKGLR
jgi:hypothetical protein